MAKIEYYMDVHVPMAVTQGLGRRGVDVLTVQDAERIGADDSAQLQYATDNQRVLVSQDTDFLVLHQDGSPHAGIV
jgi:predicted nuclease of predicted toxin-antitoxin system